MFILWGRVILWIIAIGLASYGKNTSYDKDKKKDVLNLTYQKFIYVSGLVFTYLTLLDVIIFLFIKIVLI
jgi:hypothetical protein